MLDLSIARLSAWVVFGFLIALAGAVVVKLLNGRINTGRLFDGRNQDGSQYFSLGRVQLLMFTLWTAANYISSVWNGENRGALPDIPPQTLALLGGSHILYLGGKAYSMLWLKQQLGNKED